MAIIDGMNDNNLKKVTPSEGTPVVSINGVLFPVGVGGGSDIDLEGVNVTADTLLSGTVAIDASGAKVTGSIETVSLTRDGNTVSVAKGFTEGGSITVPSSGGEMDELTLFDWMTITKNY